MTHSYEPLLQYVYRDINISRCWEGRNYNKKLGESGLKHESHEPQEVEKHWVRDGRKHSWEELRFKAQHDMTHLKHLKQIAGKHEGEMRGTRK